MEISEALKWSINRVTGRTNEMVKRGLVEEAGERACKITTRKVKSWRIVKKQTTKDPSIYRCKHCPKNAVTLKNTTPFCQEHCVNSSTLGSLFWELMRVAFMGRRVLPRKAIHTQYLADSRPAHNRLGQCEEAHRHTGNCSSHW
jgi:hypothetical protein